METKTVATRLERTIAEALAKKADERGLLMSELVRYVLSGWVTGEFDNALRFVATSAAFDAIIEVAGDTSTEESNRIAREIGERWEDEFTNLLDAGDGYLRRAYR